MGDYSWLEDVNMTEFQKYPLPADNDFQHGYLMALAELWRVSGVPDTEVDAVVRAHSQSETQRERFGRLGLRLIESGGDAVG